MTPFATLHGIQNLPRSIRRLGFAWACAGALSTSMIAQETTSEEVIMLEAFIAAAEADVYEVLPTRESTAVFGTSRNLAETPRSVTLIESALTDLYGIRTVNDFVSVTAGSFTGNYFGVPGALDIRGERADNFFRGMRRIENRGNFPPPSPLRTTWRSSRGPLLPSTEVER